MARKKTTIYLEPDLLTATKTLAASSGRREYEVIEDALSAYMRSDEAAAGRRELHAMLDRWFGCPPCRDRLKPTDLRETASTRIAPGRLLAAWLDGRFEMIVSPALLAELAGVLERPKFRRWLPVEEACAFVRMLRVSATVLNDPLGGPIARARRYRRGLRAAPFKRGTGLALVTVAFCRSIRRSARRWSAGRRSAGEIKQRSSKRGKQSPPAISNEHANPCFIGIRALPTPPIEPQTAFASRRSPVRSRLAPLENHLQISHFL
jgi:hypothetical protein